MRRIGFVDASAVVAVLSFACGPELDEALMFEELCGVEEPVQVLALRDDEAVTTWGTARNGDRWLYAVERFDRPILDIVEAGFSGPYRVVPQIDARIESVDRCGDDRRVVAEGIDWMVPPENDDAPWLGYRRDTGMLFVFDPEGSEPARPLARPENPAWHLVDRSSVILRRDDTRDVVRFTVEGPNVHTQVLATNVARMSIWRSALPPSSILVLRDDGDLEELSLSTDESVLVRAGVGWFSSSTDPRFLVWVDGRPEDFGNSLPTGANLLDRATGEGVSLGGGGPTMAQIIGSYVVANVFDGERIVSTTFLSLPDLSSITLDGTWWYFGEGPDGRLGVLNPSGVPMPDGYVIGRVDGQLQLLAGPVPATTSAHGGLWFHDDSPYVDLQGAGSGRPYDVVRLSLSTLETEIVARRIWSDIQLPGDRFVHVSTSESGAGLGDLLVIDGADGESHRLDRDVVVPVAAFEPHESSGSMPWQTDELVYQVRAPGSGRTGLWRVRP